MKTLFKSWLARWRRSRRLAAENRLMMRLLHASSAWDCGCWEHQRRGVATVGLVSRRRRLFGFLPMEHVQLTPTEWKRLFGNK